MLSFFRRLTNSKLGAIVAFIVLGLVALAFAAGDVTGLRQGSGGMTALTAAHVGKADVTEAELVSRTRNALKSYQEQQPGLDMAAFLAGGGLDGTLEQLINGVAVEQFALAQGMRVSKRAIDGQIAGIPALRGVDGKFSQAAYDRILAEQRISDAQVRGDMIRETFAQQLIAPTAGAKQVGVELARPYAELLLERRRGAVAILPVAALPAAPAPTAAEVQAWYARNVARYTIPERRVVRYALVDPTTVKAQSTPTEADLAAAYRDAGTRFAATEKRDVEIATALDQATANGLAAKARAGQSLAEAARSVGLEARTLPGVDKPTLARQVAPALADAAFGAAPNALVGPTRVTGSWVVFRVTKVEKVAAKSLAEARAALLSEVTTAKTSEAIGKLNDALDKAAGEGATFDELVKDQRLTAQGTPPLLATGQDPLNPAFVPIPALRPILQGGFAAEQGDAPQIVQTAPDGSFALVALDRIVPAAPRPLTEIRAQVAGDFATDRALKAARKIAAEVVARVDGGMPLAAALAATRLSLPPVRAVDAPRAQLAADPRGAPAALALMFAMAPRKAKLLEAPNGIGWNIVYLDSIQRGDARANPGVVASTRADLARVVGREYVAQFGRAVRNAVGVRQNQTALARARAQLSGQSGEGQP